MFKMNTNVVNIKKTKKYDVYIGRGSKWGNPFQMKNPSQEERNRVCEEYEAYFKTTDLIKDIRGLRGKTLGCYCSPQRCHGDFLARLANEYTPKILQCDSKGDKRFSAFYAKVSIKDRKPISIEKYYQSIKRDENGKIPGKGKTVDHCIIEGKRYPASKLTWAYRRLWKLYFEQNPELLRYAEQFDEFTDRFKGKAINCQSDVIRDLVNEHKGV
jgi:hypothetical protein